MITAIGDDGSHSQLAKGLEAGSPLPKSSCWVLWAITLTPVDAEGPTVSCQPPRGSSEGPGSSGIITEAPPSPQLPRFLENWSLEMTH